MNEIVEQLQAVNQDRFASIELPDEDDLVEIQEQLLIHLPADFKDYLLNVSNVVYGHLCPVTVTDEYASSHLPEVAASAWDQGMPRHLLPICPDRDGYYTISPEGEVGFWSPYDPESEEHWDSIWDWCEQVWLATVQQPV